MRKFTQRMAARYTIKDLERISGIKAHTLRMWEQRYKILSPERTSTNIRYYNDGDLKRILNISLLNNNGYKISGIAKLNDEALQQTARDFLNSRHSPEGQIENLVFCLMELDQLRFNEVLHNCISGIGYENAIEKVIFPFLKHLGNMWQVGLVTPAQEHFMSALVRQKLIVALDELRVSLRPKARTYLFFLPESELHELGLLYTHYLCKAQGHRCVYLGQGLPLADVATLAESIRPDGIVSIFTNQLRDDELSELLRNMQETLKAEEILLSGRLLFEDRETPLMPSPRFKLFKDFQEFRTVI